MIDGGENMKPTTMGFILCQLRKNSAMTQKELADKLHVTDKAVSKWETDQAIPDLDKIKMLCEYFNVSIGYLVNDDTDENVIKDEVINSSL